MGSVNDTSNSGGRKPNTYFTTLGGVLRVTQLIGPERDLNEISDK